MNKFRSRYNQEMIQAQPFDPNCDLITQVTKFSDYLPEQVEYYLKLTPLESNRIEYMKAIGL